MSEKTKKIIKVVIFFILLILFSLIARPITASLYPHPTIKRLVDELIMAGGTIVLYYLFTFVLEKETCITLNLWPTLRRILRLIFGFVIGSIMMGIVSFIVTRTGAVELSPVQNPTSTFPLFVALLFIDAFLLSLWKQVAYRGYMLKRLSEAVGDHFAAIIIALIVGVLRLTCPNLTIWTLLGIAVLSLFLSYSYFLTRDIYLPLGLYFGWSWIDNIFFAGTHWHVDYRNRFIAGGIGPQEGFAATVICFIGLAIVFALYVRKKNKTGAA